MYVSTIGIIGAQGRFGQHLCRRLGAILVQSATLVPSTDKSSNEEIVRRSDVIILTVRPDQVEKALEDIPDVLRLRRNVVSFAARTPGLILESRIIGVTRIMVDPWWNMCGWVRNSSELSNEKFDSLFGNLTRMKPLELDENAELDIYSMLLAHLMVVLLFEKLNRVGNVERHLEFLAHEFSRFNRTFQPDEFRNFELGNNPEESLRELATPGGITEAVIKALQKTHEPLEVHRRTIITLGWSEFLSNNVFRGS